MALTARRILIVPLVGLIFAVAETALSQTSAPAEASDNAPTSQQIEQLRTEYESKLEEINRRLEETNRRLEETNERLESELKSPSRSTTDEEQQSIAEQWSAEAEEDEGAHTQEVPLDIYGYFDVTFYRAILPDNSLYQLALADTYTFFSSGLNLMIASQMTQHLGAFVELKFSFAPHGSEVSVATFDAVTGTQYRDYERIVNNYADVMTSQEHYYGAVAIERMHFTWAPRDWFKVLAGRFLTPFGVWNVEHGPTVIIPFHPPLMQIWRMVPPRQLGLQISGVFFPRADSSLEYYITVSNGRDGEFPTENVDLDDNKALGVGLRYNLQKTSWSVSVGGYGFIGKNTDIVKKLYLNQQDMDTEVVIEDTYREQEIDLSAFLLVKLFGIRLQSEYIWRRSEYDIHPPLDPVDLLFAGESLSNMSGNEPSYTGHGIYALLAYQLPLDRWLNTVKILPYVLYEHAVKNDLKPHYDHQLVSMGVNVRPSPWTTLKFEYLYHVPKTELMEPMQIVSLQLAISF